MAPPDNRRPTYSRRAQYGKFFAYVMAVAGLIAGFGLLLISASNQAAFSGIRTMATDVVAPAGEAAAKSRTEATGLLEAIGGFFTFGQRVARMEREIAAARVAVAEANAVRNENRELKALLQMPDDQPRRVAVARLIGSTGTSPRRFAYLGAGQAQGVRSGMTVRASTGLIGRVLEAGQSSARVLLITDSESIIPVRRARDGVPATAIGRGDGTIQIKLILQGINPLKPGDAFVTSGSGGLFWPNSIVAVVTKLTSDGAIAHPVSDPGRTEYVEVQSVWSEGSKASNSEAAMADGPTQPNRGP